MIYDRVLKSELMNSDRWLDLPSDSHRLAYVCLLPLADDFGNFEAGSRRMWRWLHARTQVKDDGHAIKILSDLMDADLIRPYTVAEADYWHIARFQCDRRYVVRRVPASPWDDPELEIKGGLIRQTRKARSIDLKEEKAKVAAKLPQSSGQVPAKLPLGVGVGVGVGVKTKTRPNLAIQPASGWSEFYAAYPRKEAKLDGLKAWNQLSPAAEVQRKIMADIGQRLGLDLWSKADVKHIPLPATYLRARRWEDELEPPIADYLRHGKVI